MKPLILFQRSSNEWIGLLDLKNKQGDQAKLDLILFSYLENYDQGEGVRLRFDKKSIWYAMTAAKLNSDSIIKILEDYSEYSPPDFLSFIKKSTEQFGKINFSVSDGIVTIKGEAIFLEKIERILNDRLSWISLDRIAIKRESDKLILFYKRVFSKNYGIGNTILRALVNIGFPPTFEGRKYECDFFEYRPSRWNRELVVQELWRTKRIHGKINRSQLNEVYPSLKAATDVYKSVSRSGMDAALEMAGFNLKIETSKPDNIETWDVDKILYLLREIDGRNEPLNQTCLEKKYPKLYYAIQTWIGHGSIRLGWRKAMEMLGKDLDEMKKAGQFLDMRERGYWSSLENIKIEALRIFSQTGCFQGSIIADNSSLKASLSSNSSPVPGSNRKERIEWLRKFISETTGSDFSSLSSKESWTKAHCVEEALKIFDQKGFFSAAAIDDQYFYNVLRIEKNEINASLPEEQRGTESCEKWLAEQIMIKRPGSLLRRTKRGRLIVMKEGAKNVTYRNDPLVSEGTDTRD